jgi:class 3 adenylate cyclase
MARAENLAVMFVDMAGYAQRTARQSREQNQALLRNFHGLLMPLIARFGGVRVKSIGDAFLVTFRSPTDGVRCGMAMHDALEHYNQQHPSPDPIQVRVALNVGEVRLEHGDIFGEAVNIAARVEELTPPGEIYLTGVVYLSMNKAEVPSEHIGEHVLKGIPEPIRLFRVPARKLARLQLSSTMDIEPGELPYGGMHVLPADADVLMKLSDTLQHARYIDWGAKVRAIQTRTVALVVGGLLLGLALGGSAYIAMRPTPPATIEAAMPAQIKPLVNQAARDALQTAHTAYFQRKRVEAAAGYAKALALEPTLRHDSGLAANLVGTLGYAGETVAQTIRKYPSAEFIYELSRRTGQPGRKGAQRAAALLKELNQEGRIDQRGLAVTELAEAPTCEERLVAVRHLRLLRDPGALPALQESVRRNFSILFQQDKNQCLRTEAEKTIAELQKLAPAAVPTS